MPKKSKIISSPEIRLFIDDGDIVVIGGILSAREPMGLIREIIRQGIKDLTTVGGAHGIDIDLLCAGGAIKAVQNSFVGMEFDFGLAPNYRRLVEIKKIEIKDSDCDFILNQLRAAQYGVPFMPMPLVAGTDLYKLHPEYKIITCPFTGKQITLVPALEPDVAIIHAHYGDSTGNIKLFKPQFADLLMAATAKKTIISVEEIVSEKEMKELEPELAFFQVDAVVHIPFGAHPTSCYPNYVYDREHIAFYMKLAQSGLEVFREEYLNPFVLGTESNEEYLELIGGDKKLQKLKSWSKSLNNWKEAFK